MEYCSQFTSFLLIFVTFPPSYTISIGTFNSSFLPIVEFLKIVTPAAHWQTSIAHNFASSYPISKILGSLESPKILLSNELKNVQIGRDLRKTE